MGKVKVYFSESEKCFSELSEYPDFYMQVKSTLERGESKDFYTDSLKMFRWIGFLKEAYPGYLELIKEEVKKKRISEVPKFPSKPDFNTLKDWKRWIVEEYFEYKRYYDSKNLVSEELNDFIDSFSRYYYDNYLGVRNSNSFISRILHDSDKFIRKDEVTVLLIIDNFNFYYKGLFSETLKGIDLSTYSEDYYFSTIPSETKYGKQALLTHNQFDFKPNWNVRKLSALEKKFPEKKVLYINKISDLNSETLYRKGTLLVVNYLELDKELHGDDKKTMMGRDERISNEFTKICKMIKARLSSDMKTSFFITTDHGSIKRYGNYKKVDNKIINSISKSKQCKVMEISDEVLEKYKGLLSDYGYVVDKSWIGIDKNYVIAKEDVFFCDMNGEMYFHGGLSPDEVCIPFMHLKNY